MTKYTCRQCKGLCFDNGDGSNITIPGGLCMNCKWGSSETVNRDTRS